MASSERFGYAWNKYNKIEAVHEEQFKNWIDPIGPDFFVGKEFLDVGCGMGRNSFWALRWGAKSCTAIDLDDRSLNRTRENLTDFKNKNVLKLSANDITWNNRFDIAFSIGVIHHLSNPQKVLDNMYRSLKSDGTMIVWVYSQEGNEWIKRYVNPLRIRIFSRLPLWIVHVVSSILVIPLYILAKSRMSKNKYLIQLSNFNLQHIRSIVFDQLIPSIANYWSRDEVKSLFSKYIFKSIVIKNPPNGQGWTIIGKK
jgi:ubiquinone/menaquinone biosynthesis C-methylase UbiE